MTPKQTLWLMKDAVSAWSEDYAPSMGAALSYYTLFSIAPLLVIVISVAGLFFGNDAVRAEIFSQIASLVGQKSALVVEDMLRTANQPKEGTIATTVSLVLLVVGATTVLGELQNALDRIWRTAEKNKSGGVWKLFRSRLLSLTMILGVAFLLMVSLVVSAGLAALGKWWGAWFRGWEVLAHVIDLALSFGMTTLLFAMIYKYVPSVHVRWRDVWIGAAFTAILFAVGKILIGLYLGKSDVATGFGAAGSLVLFMVWVYYSAQIFLIGAEFTWVYAHKFGSRADRPEPSPPPAVPVKPS